jgi:hypothetical protein
MSSLRSFVVLALTLLASAVCDASASALFREGSPSQAPSRVAPGPVVFKVTADGKPLRHALVELGGRQIFTTPRGEAIFDGVPAGRIVLRIAHPGFDLLERELSLPEGARVAQTISLVREKLVDKPKCLVLDAEAGTPISGATLRFVPIAVQAALHGPVSAVTGFDGAFRLKDLPVGIYRLSLKADGYQDLEEQVDIRSGEDPLKWSLLRDFRSAALRVSVVGAKSGAAVAGAQVSLAEAGSAGILATGTTDTKGVVSFEKLRLSDANRADANGRLLASRRSCTVTVSAAGWAAVAQPCTLGASSQARVALYQERTIEEQEPNDDKGRAQLLEPGTTVRFRIAKNGDRDWFSFRLAHPATVRLEIPAAALELANYLYDAEGKRIAQAVTYAKRPNIITVPLRAGGYSYCVAEWGDNGASEQAMELRFSADLVVDPREPNETATTARAVTSNSDLRGYIYPAGDDDWFRFRVERPGILRLHTLRPMGWEIAASLHDSSGKQLRNMSLYSGSNGEISVDVQPGVYLARIGEWGDNGQSHEPYEMALRFLPGDGVEDAQPFMPVRHAQRRLLPGTLVGTTILPSGDRDRFAVPIPTRGVLHWSFGGPLELTAGMRVGDKLLQNSSVYANRLGTRSADVGGATTWVFDLGEWGDNGWATHPYLARVWLQPADEFDLMAPNESPAHATPIEVGEWTRGTILPRKDEDWYRIAVDHPAVLKMQHRTGIENEVEICDASGKRLLRRSFYADRLESPSAHVLPPSCLIRVIDWGNDNCGTDPYAFHTLFERFDPLERVPFASDPVRQLVLGENAPYLIECPGDRDRYVVDIPTKGRVIISLNRAIETTLAVFDDRTGTKLFSRSFYANRFHDVPLDVSGPTRLRLECTDWGNDGWRMLPGWVRVAMAPAKACIADVEVAVDPVHPTRVTLKSKPIQGAAAITQWSVDVDGDGKADARAPFGQPLMPPLPQEGVYCVRVDFEGQGAPGFSRIWIQATGPRERRGLRLQIYEPMAGQAIDRAVPCRINAFSYSGAAIRSVTLRVDGRAVGTVYREPFQFDVPWRSYIGGEHELQITAVDVAGERAEEELRVRVSDYFDLQPSDAASVTGERVRVSWTGGDFGATRVRLRKKGEESWREVVGRNGRERVVWLEGLEPGVEYEWQPIGGREAGPVRTVTRIKGLAFGQPRYSANVARDYDQRLGVSVRNHAEEPRVVRLRCGSPDPESRLLVGFVGEGSKGVPFTLQPGEERDFLLGISAQDCIREKTVFPIHLDGDGGTGDTAELTIAVKLPRVDLQWSEVGATEDGLGVVLDLKNAGDTLTDLDLTTSLATVTVDPAVQHALFSAGSKLRVTVRPVLFDGYEGCRAQVIATAVGRSSIQEVELEVPEGKRVYAVRVEPGEADSGPEARRRAACSLVGAFLNPNAVDWSQRRDGRDTDGDGKADRWEIHNELDNILWVGEDTDADGEVDFVHADVGHDGQFDYSAIRGEKGWVRTNLVEAYLEMDFALPWKRSAYEKHDLDLVMGEQVIGALRDTVPEGNYVFKLPPSALSFTEAGTPGDNVVEIRSRHLRGGHYVVSSDFRLKLRMTGSELFTVAEDRESAERKVREMPGLVLDGPDYSVSSAETQVLGTPAKGKRVEIVATVRNLGASRSGQVAVALLRAEPGKEGIEVARSYLEDAPLVGESTVRLSWMGVPGTHQLVVMVDPDDQVGDTARDNNRAVINLSVPGEHADPSMKIEVPASNARFAAGAGVELRVRAEDDCGVAAVEWSVAGGLYHALTSRGDGLYTGSALLQTGSHKIRIRCIDTGGKQVEESVAVRVDGEAPSVAIEAPAERSKIMTPSTSVRVRVGDRAVMAAVRMRGGAWRRCTPAAGLAICELPVPFGRSSIEAMAVDAHGMRRVTRIDVEGGYQPEAEKKDEAGEVLPPEQADGNLELPDGSTVDMFGPPNAPIRPQAASAASGGAGAANRGRGSSAAPSSAAAGAGAAARAHGAAPASSAARGRNKLPELAPEPEGGRAPDSEWEPRVPWQPRPEDALATPDPRVREPGVGMGKRPGSAADRPGAASFTRVPPYQRRGGAAIAARAKQKSWYCTNRPTIRARFRLPEYLRKILKENQGLTKKQLNAKIERMLIDFAVRSGIPVSKLRAMRKMGLRRIKGMQQADELPGFLESFGWGADPTAADINQENLWRLRQERRFDIWFLTHLAAKDKKDWATGMRARMDSYRKFDEGFQMAAQAAIDSIDAHQSLAEETVEALPGVGDVLDVYASVTGRTLLADKQLSSFERALRLGAVFGPDLLTAWIKRSPGAQQVVQALGEMAHTMGKDGTEALARMLGKNTKDVERGLAAFGEFLTKERKLFGNTLEETGEKAAKTFKHIDGAADAQKRFAKDLDEAEKLVERLKKADPDSPDFKKLVEEVQTNKTAQRVMNGDGVTDGLRQQAKEVMETTYKQADAGVKENLERICRAGDDMPAEDLAKLADEAGLTVKQAEDLQKQVNDLAKKHGIHPSEIEVGTLSITNKRGGGKVSFGRDRDVTFTFKRKMPDPYNPSKVRIDPGTGKPMYMDIGDIDHSLTKGPYEKEFYKAAKGAPPADKAAAEAYAKQMDQTVTSAKHREAYKTGDVQLEDFLDKGKVPTLQEIDEVVDTVKFKSQHWFKEASAATDPVMKARNAVEGMRQATKQYDDLVMSRVKQFGVGKSHIPPDLAAGIDVFKKAADGKIPFEQAEYMLQKMGTSKEQVLESMGGYLKKLETETGVVWRELKTAGLVKELEAMPGQGTKRWVDNGMHKLNQALSEGKITPQHFVQLRDSIGKDFVAQLKNQGTTWGEELRRWCANAYARRIISGAEKARYERMAEGN